MNDDIDSGIAGVFTQFKQFTQVLINLVGKYKDTFLLIGSFSSNLSLDSAIIVTIAVVATIRNSVTITETVFVQYDII